MICKKCVGSLKATIPAPLVETLEKVEHTYHLSATCPDIDPGPHHNIDPDYLEALQKLPNPADSNEKG